MCVCVRERECVCLLIRILKDPFPVQKKSALAFHFILSLSACWECYMCVACIFIVIFVIIIYTVGMFCISYRVSVFVLLRWCTDWWRRNSYGKCSWAGQRSRYRPGVWPKGFQEVKVPRFHDNGTGWCKVSLTRRPPLPPGNAPGAHFC